MHGNHHQGFTLAGFNFGVRVWRMPTQSAAGVAVQVFQQFAFPGVPDLRRRASDVGDGE
jgi:hypothetical protein